MLHFHHGHSGTQTNEAATISNTTGGGVAGKSNLGWGGSVCGSCSMCPEETHTFLMELICQT